MTNSPSVPLAESPEADDRLGYAIAERLIAAIVAYQADTLDDLPPELVTEILESESTRFGMSAEVAVEILRYGPSAAAAPGF